MIDSIHLFILYIHTSDSQNCGRKEIRSAWHLASEARIIFSSNGEDFLSQLGLPAVYQKCKEDCRKFYNLYCKAIESISCGSSSLVFELSSIFLAIRNFATCFLLGTRQIRNFSRRSALQMDGQSIKIHPDTFKLLERARILSIRGTGDIINQDDLKSSLEDICSIKTWMIVCLTRLKTMDEFNNIMDAQRRFSKL